MLRAVRYKMDAILIVEDNTELREVLSCGLVMMGYEVFSAGNGLEALFILESVNPRCLILLDLRMPLMDGKTFLKALGEHEEYSTCPVVIMSTERAIPTGQVVGVLPKPYDFDEVLSIAKEHCFSRDEHHAS